MEYEVIVNNRTVYRGADVNTAGDTFEWYKENKALMNITEVILMNVEEGFIIEG